MATSQDRSGYINQFDQKIIPLKSNINKFLQSTVYGPAENSSSDKMPEKNRSWKITHAKILDTRSTLIIMWDNYLKFITSIVGWLINSSLIMRQPKGLDTSRDGWWRALEALVKRATSTSRHIYENAFELQIKFVEPQDLLSINEGEIQPPIRRSQSWRYISLWMP